MGAVALWLGTAFVFAPLALAAPKSDKPDALPSLKTLSEPKKSMREAHREVLNSLYEQLRKTDSEAGAELIASAIEKLWARSGSDTADILMERAGLAIKARNYNLATRILSALTEVEPGYAAGWNQLATVYFLEDRYFEAMQQLRQVLAIDPRHYKAIEGLGIILRETGNKKAALAVTRRALAVNPHMKSAKQAEQELAREVEGQEI